MTFNLIYTLDQSLRRIYIKGTSRAFVLPISVAIFFLDRIARCIFKTYMLKYGWPKLSMFGRKINETAFFVVMHMPAHEMLNALRILRNAVTIYEAPSEYIAMITDRILMHRKKPQIFGTEITPGSRLGLVNDFIWPMIDFERINRRRLAIGIKSTIEEYASSNEASLFKHQCAEEMTSLLN